MCGMMRGIVYGELKRTLNNYYTAEFRSSSNAIVGSMSSCVYVLYGKMKDEFAGTFPPSLLSSFFCCLSLRTLCCFYGSLVRTKRCSKVFLAYQSPPKTNTQIIERIIVSKFGGDDPMFNCSILSILPFSSSSHPRLYLAVACPPMAACSK